MKENRKVIAEKFRLAGEITEISPYGKGHINVTSLVKAGNQNYILQKINSFVFPSPETLMENIERVTAHLRSKGIETLHLVPLKEGGNLLFQDSEYYRVYDFIEHTVTYQTAENDRIFRNVARAFGDFQKALSDFDTSLLHETIPHFHDTPKRFRDFEKALATDACGRAKNCRSETEFVLSREGTLGRIVQGLSDGTLPYRVTHNDTKLNNILMDETTSEARAVIDLDTVMPGSLLYDFGDSIRFGASTAAEDEPDPEKVHLSLPAFRTYSEGYLEALRDNITEREKELLPYSAYLMMIECGMRFLSDYLSGDVYFATAYPEHNLVRARTQFRLAAETEQKRNILWKMIKNMG